jgi:CRISPR-associated protein Cmr4
MNTNKVWLITAKTNLHVGNENTSNYGLIDKSVQRDVLTGLPSINGSSLKGAINEYFTVEKEKDERFLKNVFGVDKKGRDQETQKGGYSFFDAQLLSIPVQSNDRLFYRATSPAVLQQFANQLKLFGIPFKPINLNGIEPEEKPIVFTTGNIPTFLGDFKTVRNPLNDEIKRLEILLGGKDVAIFSNKDFLELCDDDNLPIIARNKLDNGESVNLWYEQIIPQETVFYSIFLKTCNVNIEPDLDGSIVQIGANATIGYGYCMFKALNQ